MPHKDTQMEDRSGICREEFIEKWAVATGLVDTLSKKELHAWSTQLGEQSWVAQDFGVRAAELASTRRSSSYPSDTPHWESVGTLYKTFGVDLALFSASFYDRVRSARPSIRGDKKASAKLTTACRGVTSYARTFMVSGEFPDGPVISPRNRLERFLVSSDDYVPVIHHWCLKELTYGLRLALSGFDPDSASTEIFLEMINELLGRFGEPQRQILRSSTEPERRRAGDDITVAMNSDSLTSTFKQKSTATGIPDQDLIDQVHDKALQSYLNKIIRGQAWTADLVVQQCIDDIDNDTAHKELDIGIDESWTPTEAQRRRADKEITSAVNSDEFIAAFTRKSTATGMSDQALKDRVHAKAVDSYLGKIIRGQAWTADRVVRQCINDIVGHAGQQKARRLRDIAAPAPKPAPPRPAGKLQPELVEVFEQLHRDVLDHPQYSPDDGHDSWEKSTVLALLREWIDTLNPDLTNDTAVKLELIVRAQIAWQSGTPPTAVSSTAEKAARTAILVFEIPSQ